MTTIPEKPDDQLQEAIEDVLLHTAIYLCRSRLICDILLKKNY